MGSRGSGASRGGGEGIHNEDVSLVEEGLGLHVVCDGASGTPGGEIAARVATEAVEDFVERAGEDFEFVEGRIGRRVVEKAMHHALSSVLDAERTRSDLVGLTTTVTMLLVHGRFGAFGHCGDSRAYLIRRDRAHQLTVDHELTDAATHGSERELDFDVFSLDLERGDTIVLCSDGAEEVVGDASIVRSARTLSPRVLASRIVAMAHRRAPSQDATAVVVRVRADFEPGWLELSEPSRGTAFGHTLQPV